MMNDHDEAHLFDDEYSLTADDAYSMEEELEDRRERQKKILNGYRDDHGFMFVKRQDHEDWEELVRKVLNA